MNDSTQTLLRSLLKIGAGWLIAKGYLKADDETMAIGGAVALAGVIWGLLHRVKAPASTSSTKPPGQILFLILALILPATAVMTGCRSTPEAIAYKTVAASNVTLQSAMTAWGDYCTQFNPSYQDRLKVKDLYDKAKAAELAALDAARLVITLTSTNALPRSLDDATAAQASAQAQASQALASLVDVLRSFNVKL